MKLIFINKNIFNEKSLTDKSNEESLEISLESSSLTD